MKIANLNGQVKKFSFRAPRPAIVLALCGYAVVVMSFVLSLASGDGQWFQRSGAVPVWMGALIALLTSKDDRANKQDQTIGLILILVGTPIWSGGDIVAAFLRPLLVLVDV